MKAVYNEIKVRKQLIHKYLLKSKIINYVLFTSIFRGTLGYMAANVKCMDRYPILRILDKRMRIKTYYNEDITKISEKE